MRRALTNLNSDLIQQYPDYVCRVTSEEGDVGRGHLSKFQELETITPTIVTTSQLLTTGVDIPTCKNIVIARVINSMVEFKQVIGRGTRVRDDYGKYFFNILDYTGSATRLFADPEFDGKPALISEEEISAAGETTSQTYQPVGETLGDEPEERETSPVISDDSEGNRQAQSGSCASFLRREERHEETGPQGPRDPGTAVADLQADHLRGALVPAPVLGSDGRCHDCDTPRSAGGLDGLDGVEREVQQHLLHLGAVDFDRRQVGRDLDLDLDTAGTDRVGLQAEHAQQLGVRLPFRKVLI